MKKLILSVVAMLSMALAADAQTYMHVETSDGEINSYDVEKVVKVDYGRTKIIKPTVSGTVGTYEYVDLGLPSGTMWATRNVGASDPTAAGAHFAWGETNVKEDFSFSTYKWCTVDAKGDLDEYTKYNNDDTYKVVDNKSVLELADDAANYFCGEQWSLPTKEDFQELIDGCYWRWEGNYNGTFGGNGVAGYLGTSKQNLKTIFFPASGNVEGEETKNVNKQGLYWTSSHDEKITDNAMGFLFSDGNAKISTSRRYKGCSVRGVCRTATVSGWRGHNKYVDLGLSVKWATCNVGAGISDKPWEIGGHYAWGETWTKSEYDHRNYRFNKLFPRFEPCEPSYMSEYDVNVDWPNGWRMPTLDEIKELLDGCYWEWVDDYVGTGVSGRLGTSKINGNTIFLPFAGAKMTSMSEYLSGLKPTDLEKLCYYWSSTVDDGEPGTLVFHSAAMRDAILPRYVGCLVRAVYDDDEE